MKKSEFAKFLREKQLLQAGKLSRAMGIPKSTMIMTIKKLPDNDIINTYRICSVCGGEYYSKEEIDLMIQNSDSSEKIWEIFATHYPSCGHIMGAVL